MNFDNALKILTVLGAIASFLWGVYQWREKSSQELEAQKQESARLVETRRIEATKPFLERQLALYAEATKIAAQVATQGNSDSGKKALVRFWELYCGELALVASFVLFALCLPNDGYYIEGPDPRAWSAAWGLLLLVGWESLRERSLG